VTAKRGPDRGGLNTACERDRDADMLRKPAGVLEMRGSQFDQEWMAMGEERDAANRAVTNEWRVA
jgi:hypothetical protein